MMLVVGIAATVSLRGSGPIDQEPAGLPPESPRVGDRGTFTRGVVRVSEGGAVDVVEPEVPYLAFERVPGEYLADAAGRQRWSLPVRVRDESGPRLPAGPVLDSTLHFDSETRELLAEDLLVRGSLRGSGGLPEFADGARGGLQRIRFYQLPEGPWGRPPCVLAMGDAASESVGGRPMNGMGPCRIADREVSEAALVAAGADSVAGAPAVVYGLEPGGDGHRPLLAWFISDVPYPVRLLVERVDQPSLYDLVRLTRFERGHQPYDGPPPAPAAAADLVWAPRHVWGPLDDEAPHPFPLSAAFSFARDDPLEARFRQFLGEHPGAFVHAASYDEVTRRAAAAAITERTWYFVAGDEDDEMTLHVQQVVQRPAFVQSTVDALDGRLDTAPVHRYAPGSFAQRPTPVDHRGMDPQAAWPTSDSMLRRWQAYGPSAEPGNGWGFGPYCPMPPCEGGVHFWAGRFENVGRSPLDSDGGVQRQSVVVFNAHGVAVSSQQSVVASSRRSLLEDSGLPTLDTSFFAAAAALDAGPWSPPLWIWGLGAGLVALLAGAAGSVWSALKSAAARLLDATPLSTRVERDRVLDHPLRREIHALIEQNPGIHLRELARRVRREFGVLRHHLDMLLRLGLILHRHSHGYTCFYLAAGFDRRQADAMPVLRSESARRILAALVGRPESTGAELAAATGLHRTTVRHHLARFGSVELVEVSRTPGDRRVRLKPLGLEVFQRHVRGAGPG